VGAPVFTSQVPIFEKYDVKKKIANGLRIVETNKYTKIVVD
jgi:hypothetical protein